MQKLILILGIAITITCTACHTDTSQQDTAEATIASETGIPASLPPDAISVTKPLISGNLYSQPDFGSTTLTHFDTTQQILLLDTSDVLFIKARINKNSETYTGYISRAILPETAKKRTL